MVMCESCQLNIEDYETIMVDFEGDPETLCPICAVMDLPFLIKNKQFEKQLNEFTRKMIFKEKEIPKPIPTET